MEYPEVVRLAKASLSETEKETELLLGPIFKNKFLQNFSKKMRGEKKNEQEDN